MGTQGFMILFDIYVYLKILCIKVKKINKCMSMFCIYLVFIIGVASHP